MSDRGIAIQHLNRALKAEAEVEELKKVVRGYEITLDQVMHTIGKYFKGEMVQEVYEDMYKIEPGNAEGLQGNVGDTGDTKGA